MRNALQEIKSYSTGFKIFYFGLFLMSIGLPTSRFLMSISYIFMGLGWLIHKERTARLKTFFTLNPAILFSGVYLLHVLSIFWSEDLIYAWKDLRIKMPLLFFPFMVYTMPKMTKDIWLSLLKFFILSTLISAISSVYFYVAYQLGWMSEPFVDIRQISKITSHIRLALMVTLSTIWIVFKGEEMGWYSWYHRLMVVFFIGFLVLLQSMTGIVVLVLAIALLSIFKFKKFPSIVAYSSYGFVLAAILGLVFIVQQEYNFVFKIIESPINEVVIKSEKGNLFRSNTKSLASENGYLVGLNIQRKELKEEWNKRSKLAYSGKDLMGNQLRFTLIRFLSSKGLYKDASAVLSLSKEEVQAIEKGMANYRYLHISGIEKRVNQILFEIKQQMNGADPNGHSLVQRFEFVKTGWAIFLKNKFIGVGVGDVRGSFSEQYKLDGSALKKENRLRSHNQLLTFLLTFGVLGFGYILFAWIYTFINWSPAKSIYFIAFFLVFIISCFNEDTLETQAGLSFYGFFTSLLLFGHSKIKN